MLPRYIINDDYHAYTEKCFSKNLIQYVVVESLFEFNIYTQVFA